VRDPPARQRWQTVPHLAVRTGEARLAPTERGTCIDRAESQATVGLRHPPLPPV